MKLRDRLRRWWSPARWEDDHLAERRQRELPQRKQLSRWFSSTLTSEALEDAQPVNFERDFKKPK
jgi:hypothetical protein